jgi:hypothetical protein
MNQNGRHRNVAVIETVDEETRADEATSFYDTREPVLKPAKELETKKRGNWKRKLVGWSFVLLLIAGGAVALYLLLRVNRVNVRVQADSPRDAQSAKPKGEANNSENAVTAEAINIAREAAGLDSGASRNPSASASPNASPAPSPSIQFVKGPNLAFTGNSSPATDRIDNEASNGNANQQQNNGMTPPVKNTDISATAVLQSHANATQSLYVEDLLPKTSNDRSVIPLQSRLEKTPVSMIASKPSPAILPPFGTMLPVRTQGVIFTLRNNSYARLELMRDCAGAGWALTKGTVLVGRTSGSESDRAFVNVIGYIDPRDNKLVKMTGDVLGADGASGIPGKRMGVDRNRLKQTLRKVAASGVQIAGSMAGALTGRGTVVIDSAGYRLMNPLTNDARGMISGNNDRNSFVKVEAGRAAYVMVADLPKSLQAVDAPGDDELGRAANSLTDREVMELILFGTPEEIRAALPLMNDEQKRLAIKTVAAQSDKQ